MEHKRESGGKKTCRQIEKIRLERGNRCEYVENGQRCTENMGLEFAHVTEYEPSTSRGRGSWVRWKEIEKGGVALFCSWHHKRYDKGEIQFNGMLSPKYLKENVHSYHTETI